MQSRRFYFVALTALFVAAGGWWFARSTALLPSPFRAESAANEPAGEEESDAPLFHLDLPEGRQPTRWHYLDDSGNSHRCNQDNTMQLQNECPVAANPANPSAVIVGANDWRFNGNVAAAYYRTTNEGVTWQDAIITYGAPGNGCPYAGDPAIAADGEGRFYATYCGYYCTGPQAIFNQTSVDNGQTWSAPVTIMSGPSDETTLDKVLSACDYSPDSPYYGNHYVAWMQVTNYSVRVAHSSNGGISYSAPVQISTLTNCWEPSLAVGPNGEVYAAWNNYGNHHVYFDRSLDGGTTWGNDIAVHAYQDYSVVGAGGCGTYRVYPYPVVACDISNSPQHGWIYMCWFGAHTGTAADICFSRSIDGGQTWSDSSLVNNDGTPRSQWFPWMAVHPVTGDIGIAWLDKRQDGQNCRYAIWGTISTDGGETWAPNFQISDTLVNPTNSTFIGDYIGTTFCNLGFFTAWPDPRNDECDVYATWWNNGTGLQITSPLPGASLTPMTTDTVKWTFRYAADSMRLDANYHYPAGEWQHLADVRSRDSLFVWNVPDSLTAQVRLRLTGIGAASVGDTTDGNFIIGLAPPTRLTCYRVGNDIRLRWHSSDAAYYRVLSSPNGDGPFDTLEGTTTGTVFLDQGAAAEAQKFYVVIASDEP